MKRMAIVLIAIILALSMLLLTACNNVLKPDETKTETNHLQSSQTSDSEQTGNDMNHEKPKYLANTLYKIQSEKKLTVGFFGGSVTVGTGSTDKERNSWRALTREWFKAAFNHVEIAEVNAAIGNTGSVFGVYRIDEQYIGKQAPDLNFIEMAINDSIDFLNGSRVYDTDENYIYIETIIRKIYASNPNADIVFVLTGNYERLKNESEGGELFGCKYINIGEYYDIPVIRVGTALADKIKQENGGIFPEKENNQYPELWYKYFKDNVHPSDVGHYVYSKTVIDFLKSLLTSGYKSSDATEKILPEKTYCESNGYGNLMMDACMISPNQFSGSRDLGGYMIASNGDNALIPYMLVSEADGDEIVLTFNTSTFAIWTLAPKTEDKTTIICSIDGGSEKSFEIFYNSSSKNNKVFMLAENLSAGIHTIRIKHDGTNRLEIRYFLLSGCFGSSPALNVAPLQK